MLPNFYKPVTNRLHVTTGEVLEVDNQRYSSTTVSADRDGVSSHVNHHQIQKVYYRNTSDGSENSWNFRDMDLDIRAGQKIRFLHGARTFTLFRFLNMSNDTFWRINVAESTNTKFQAVKRALWILLTSHFFAAVASIPILSVANVLRLGYLGLNDEFRRIKLPQTILQLLIVSASLLAFLPFVYPAAPDFGLAAKVKVDKSSYLYKFSEAVRVEQTPRPKWAENQKRIFYLQASQFILAMLITWYHIINQATTWYISNGLDWTARRILKLKDT